MNMRKSPTIKLAVSIVTYETCPHELATALRTLKSLPYRAIVTVIDNSSLNFLRECVEKTMPEAIYIHVQRNIGFGAGHNIALKHSFQNNILYHLVMNVDLEFTAETICTMTQFLNNHENCSAVTPRAFYPTGQEQYLSRKLPTPMNLVLRYLLPNASITKRLNYNYELQYLDRSKISSVPTASGCFLLMRMSTLQKVGVFDEGYFMYMEDIDLTRRISDLSDIAYLPSVQIIHKHSKGSFKKLKLFLHHVKSACRYFIKWGLFWILQKLLVTTKNGNAKYF